MKGGGWHCKKKLNGAVKNAEWVVKNTEWLCEMLNDTVKGAERRCERC